MAAKKKKPEQSTSSKVKKICIFATAMSFNGATVTVRVLMEYKLNYSTNL